MVALVTSLDDDELARTCEACPAWSLQDVLAHHVHYLGAVVAGQVPDAMYAALGGSDAEERAAAGTERDDWTQAGVEERRGRSVAELLAEWDEVVASMDERAAHTSLDLTMHLFDVRETLDDPTGQTSALVADALAGYYWFSLVPRLDAAGQSVTLTGTDLDLGLETAGAPIVAGRAYDLLRCVGGRRTRHEAIEIARAALASFIDEQRVPT